MAEEAGQERDWQEDRRDHAELLHHHVQLVRDGREIDVHSPDVAKLASDDALKCATFRVDFHSVLHADLPGGSFDYQLVSQAPVTLTGNGVLTGSGDLTYAMTRGQLVKTDPCPTGGGSITQTTTIVGTTPSVLTVTKLEPPI